MKLIMPDYCRKFRCIADKCLDNCCNGWGIYIDDETLEAYRNTEGDFGERLKNNIDFEKKCFMNNGSGRCPFLNRQNLCDIIIKLGEDKLCSICKRHPRYFEWFSDYIEGGIGLSCEEAARLILGADGFGLYSCEAPAELCAESDTEPQYDELYFKFLSGARKKMIELLLDENVPLDTSLGMLTAYAEELQERTDRYLIGDVPDIKETDKSLDTRRALRIMRNAVPADEAQRKYLSELCAFFKGKNDPETIHSENEKELRNTAVYFTWRYLMKSVFSGNVYPRIMFAVFGTKIINAMFNYEMRLGEHLGFEQKCAIAKLFSKLIEYNEDNFYLVIENYEY